MREPHYNIFQFFFLLIFFSPGSNIVLIKAEKKSKPPRGILRLKDIPLGIAACIKGRRKWVDQSYKKSHDVQWKISYLLLAHLDFMSFLRPWIIDVKFLSSQK